MAHKHKTIPVSVLKNNLLEIVREVQKGKGFRISKGGTIVAELMPASDETLDHFGFAKTSITEDLHIPDSEAPWTFDAKNIK